MFIGKYIKSFHQELEKIGQDNLNGDLHIEREKRIKLEELPKECFKVPHTIIKQGVIREVKNDNDIVCYARIRMKQEPGKEPKYSLGVKHFPLKQESEAEISKDVFESFYPKHLDKPQEKKRYSLKNGWDIDHTTDGKIIAEYEHGKGEKIVIPKHWNIKEEK